MPWWIWLILALFMLAMLVAGGGEWGVRGLRRRKLRGVVKASDDAVAAPAALSADGPMQLRQA
ncbi:MAG: hypothetical protein K2I40_01635, partial [Bifidobacterium castoris]|nr:hypothetical protein [Bifidobacterium castoris]